MATFDDVTTWDQGEDGVYRGAFPEDWGQGRATFGGILGALSLRAMRGRIDPARRIRTVQVTFLGPVAPVEAELRVRILREGRSVSFVEAEITQEGTSRLRITGAFGADRSSVARVANEPIDLPDFGAALALPFIPNVVPQFMQHVDARWTHGGFPFTSQKSSRVAAYLRFAAGATPGPERLVGLLDVLPSPILQQLRGPAPASSITWTAHLLRDDDLAEDGYAWLDYDALSAGDGYNTALCKLYGADGRLLAWSEQLQAVFG